MGSGTNGLTVAEALAHATESINESRDFEDTLDAIVHATRTSLPEFGHVSISLRHRDRTIETKAGTDQLVWELDNVQYGLARVRASRRLRRSRSWSSSTSDTTSAGPATSPRRLAKGVRSQVAVRLFSRGRHMGGLNLYSTDHDEVDEGCVGTARLFATHAAVVLGHVEQEDQLHEALQSRKVIGQAIGIVMERYRVDAERAFQFLMRASQNSNVKLRDVATEVVSSSIEAYRTDVPVGTSRINGS